MLFDRLCSRLGYTRHQVHHNGDTVSFAKRYGASSARSGGDGLFIKLTDGDSVDFVVYDDPHEEVTKWTDGKSEPCDRSDPDARVSILLPVYVVSKRAKGATKSEAVGNTKILRLTERTFGLLCETMDEPDIGGLMQVYRLKRQGAGLDTKYGIQRISAPDDSARRAYDAASYPDLAKYGTPLEPRSAPEATEPLDEEVPF